MKTLSLTICGCAAFLLFDASEADFAQPVIKSWTMMEKNDKGVEKPVHYMTIDGIMVHETDPEKRAQPPIVTPEGTGDLSPPPPGAKVLFDGSGLSNWTSTKKGEATKWVVRDGVLSPTRKSGYIRTKEEFGSCQLHVEFATPRRVKGSGQGRGNSGVFMMGVYEVQVLDSFDNSTYPDGQAGALYGRNPPLVNASRKPGEWQSYDIEFHRPVFEDGKVVKRAVFTVHHNGVLIQDAYELSGGTGWNGGHSVTEYEPHGDKGPLMLQDHGNPVLFRNIWIKELED